MTGLGLVLGLGGLDLGLGLDNIFFYLFSIKLLLCKRELNRDFEGEL